MLNNSPCFIFRKKKFNSRMTMVQRPPGPRGSASDRDGTLKPSTTLTFGSLVEGEVFYNVYAKLVVYCSVRIFKLLLKLQQN